MNKKIWTVAFLTWIFYQLIAVPPVPEKKNGILNIPSFPSEQFGNQILNRNSNVPDSILVLRVEFSDVSFDLTPDYPDFVAHDQSYFERWMFHLSSYFHDASHGKYVLDESHYTVWPNVITLSNTMAYYGDDDKWIERVSEFVQTTFQQADSEIDYSNYDSFIIFHAGAGQEADLSGENEDALWSTFLTRKSLQAGLDPENDDFEGIQTDEKIIREIILLPETEWQPDNIPNESPKYGLLGVLAHEFGHQLGLPTLFDNNSSNGVSYGIGNFGVMGTGAWNAKGFVPPLPCAWSRYYLGWEDGNIETIEMNATSISISNPSSSSSHTKMVKIPISDKEYFLIENRQYNPDNSTLNGYPNFTFELLPPEQQDYYLDPDTGEPTNIPQFNIMENSYLGCEWDFFLPGKGYGDATGDDGITENGSGLLIWHVDEYLIEQTFTEDFYYNSVNANAVHKGVDLEEADGIQHLDAMIDLNSLGSPYDAFRAGNNDYFGSEFYPDTSNLWFPNAESYYGGIPVEISNISESANTMNFDVTFRWQLRANKINGEPYVGENPYPAIFLNIDADEALEKIYPMPTGTLNVWDDDDTPIAVTYQDIESLEYIYSYDTSNHDFYFPCYEGLSHTAVLRVLGETLNNELMNMSFSGKRWAAPILVNPDLEKIAYAVMDYTYVGEYKSVIKKIENYEITLSVSSVYQIVSNLMYADEKLFYFTYDDEFALRSLNPLNFHPEDVFSLDCITENDNFQHAIAADIIGDETDEFICTVNDSLVYAFNASGQCFENFPVNTHLKKSSIPSIADVTGDGRLDILIGGENKFVAVDCFGNLYQPSEKVVSEDSLNIAAGAIAIDIDNNGSLEVISNVSKNRFCVWKNVNKNNFVVDNDYTISYGNRSWNYPQIVSEDGELFAYISSNYGFLYRQYLTSGEKPDAWVTEYADYERTASYHFPNPMIPVTPASLFVKNETYVYPNPYNSKNNQSIVNGTIKEDVVTLRTMLSESKNVSVNVFDIAGNQIFHKETQAKSYIPVSFSLHAKKYASGMYFVLFKSDGKQKMVKFAIEK